MTDLSTSTVMFLFTARLRFTDRRTGEGRQPNGRLPSEEPGT